MPVQESDFYCESGNIWPNLLRCRAISRTVGGLRPLHAHQPPAHHVQIRQRARHKQPVRILLHATIAHLGKAKDPLDDVKRMFHLGAHARLAAIRQTLFSSVSGWLRVARRLVKSFAYGAFLVAACFWPI